MRVILLTISVAVCLSTTTPAQQPRFTWEQIRDKFLAGNPTLRAQAQSVESTRAGEITASLRPNPTFQNDTTSSTIGIYQEFEIGGKRRARLESARLATSISQTDTADIRRTLLFSLRQAFIAALLANSDLDFARQNLADYQRVIELSRLMYQQGETSKGNFLKVQLQMLQFQTDVEDALLESKTAKATLRAMIGSESLPQEFELAGELGAVPLQRTLAELQQAALANRPDLKSIQTSRDKASADFHLARANRWPDPTIGASFLHTGNEIPGPTWFEPFYPKGPTSNAMGMGVASIAIPIFNRNQGELARTKSETLKADFLVQATRNQVIQEVETAYASFESSREQVKLYEEAYLSAARESLDIQEFSYRNGAASVIDFLDAERTYRATQLAYRHELAAYLTTLAQLEEAVGAALMP
jgi:cobalt-zinc-cadmium efflux system outer membrane protein